MKLRVFVASSVEGLDVAYAVQENFQFDFDITVWSQGVFALTKGSLENLDEQSGRYDAAVFVFSPDDSSVVRGTSKATVRDNVLFELGLFIGRLGREKCFLIKPMSFSDFDLPTDLIGITPGTYDDARGDGNLVAALGPVCNKIRRALNPKADKVPPKESEPKGLASILTSVPFRLFFNPPKYSKRIVFAEDGRIVEGNNKNEHSWRVVQDKLELLRLDGKIQSRFVYDSADGSLKHTNDPDTLSIRNQFIVPDKGG